MKISFYELVGGALRFVREMEVPDFPHSSMRLPRKLEGPRYGGVRASTASRDFKYDYYELVRIRGISRSVDDFLLYVKQDGSCSIVEQVEAARRIYLQAESNRAYRELALRARAASVQEDGQ